VFSERHLYFFVCQCDIFKGKTGVTHIIGSRISKYIVQRVCFGHVLGGLPNNDHKFDFVVWEVILWGLRNAGNDNVGRRADECCYGLEEEDREAR
jgi:hypothetical protein